MRRVVLPAYGLAKCDESLVKAPRGQRRRKWARWRLSRSLVAAGSSTSKITKRLPGKLGVASWVLQATSMRDDVHVVYEG